MTPITPFDAGLIRAVSVLTAIIPVVDIDFGDPSQADIEPTVLCKWKQGLSGSFDVRSPRVFYWRDLNDRECGSPNGGTGRIENSRID